MSRYIDADEMRKDWLENGENEYVYDTNAVLDSIDNQPTADVAEVVHAEAVKFYNDVYTGKLITTCSYCDGKISPKDKWCKHCGAKMDGKKVE